MTHEQKNPERIFIHDIATPVAVALGTVDLVIDDAQSGATPIPEAALKRLEKAQAALLKIQDLMAERRNALLAGQP